MSYFVADTKKGDALTVAERIRNLEVPAGPIDAVLDTDTYNEIDDQFALSYMMLSPEKITIKGLYAAPFFNNHSTSPEDGMERSYNEIMNLLTLAGREDLKPLVFRGSKTYLPSEKEPVDSPAARELIRLAGEYTKEKPLYVVTIGCITNIASALMLEPSIASKIVVVWLGGHSIHHPDTKEFNMKQDVAAARVVFGCGVPVVQLPCQGVVSGFRISKPELEYWLVGKNPLADYLAKHTIEEADAYAKGKPWTRVIWDVTAVAWLLNDGGRFMTSALIPAPIPEYDGHYGFDERRPFLRYVTSINRDRLMEDLIGKLTK